MKKIAFSGGKGGVGKSFVSVNTALALSMAGKRVVLFDADLQLANLDVMLGTASEFTLKQVVDGTHSLREILTPGPFGVHVVTGGSAVHGLMNAGPKRMATFLGQLEELGEDHDLLLFDTGAGLDHRVMTFLRLADEIVLVTTPDPTSVTDAYATAKVLLRKEPEARIGVLVNQVRSESEARSVHTALSSITASFLNRSLPLLGWVHTDAAAVDSIRRRKPLMVSDSGARAAQDIQRFAESMIVRQPIRKSA